MYQISNSRKNKFWLQLLIAFLGDRNALPSRLQFSSHHRTEWLIGCAEGETCKNRQFYIYNYYIYSWPVSLVAVAPVLAQCTNRCTRRKGAVNAQPTNTEKPKMKKTRHHEKVVKCQNESTRVARLQSEPQGRERRRVGQNWLRMKTKAILTCESSKNLNLVCDAGGYF